MLNPSGLSALNLSRSFSGMPVLKGVSLHALPSQVTSLLGPNGSGKSTSIKILSGVLSPSSGSVNLNGCDLKESAVEFKGRLGFVPDVGGLFPRLTGWEHLELNARLRKLKNWETHARNLLFRLDLDQAAGKRSGGYSHGMSRKLSTAIAFQAEPELLLLDEPFDGVDPLGIEVMLSMVSEAKERGASILISTHLLDTIEDLSDNVYVLHHGVIKAEGSPDQLKVETQESSLTNAYKSFLR